MTQPLVQYQPLMSCIAIVPGTIAKHSTKLPCQRCVHIHARRCSTRTYCRTRRAHPALQVRLAKCLYGAHGLVSQPRSVVFGGVSRNFGGLRNFGYIYHINFWRNARNPLHVHRVFGLWGGRQFAVQIVDPGFVAPRPGLSGLCYRVPVANCS